MCCPADVLSDPESRRLYDEYGLDLATHKGAGSGRGNARQAWDEFKPYKRENKRTRARDAGHAKAAATDTAAATEPHENSKENEK